MFVYLQEHLYASWCMQIGVSTWVVSASVCVHMCMCVCVQVVVTARGRMQMDECIHNFWFRFCSTTTTTTI